MRLTQKDENGGLYTTHAFKWGMSQFCGEAIDKLAAYEDLADLEQVAEWSKANAEGRLVILPKCDDCYYKYVRDNLEKVVLLEEAEDYEYEPCSYCVIMNGISNNFEPKEAAKGDK